MATRNPRHVSIKNDHPVSIRRFGTEIERRTVRGRLSVVGSPQVKLGDSIRIREVPDEPLNGVFQVRAVKHRITKAQGFTTNISFRSI